VTTGGVEEVPEMADRLTRITIVSEDKCKAKKYRQECKKSCPVVKTGKFPSFPATCFLSPWVVSAVLDLDP
jgi:hypothetical protein